MSAQEEAVEIVARAVLSARWPTGDLIAALTNRTAPMVAESVLEALDTAGLLATEQEWGVRWNSELGQKREAAISSEERAREWAALGGRGGTVVSRGVTAWREQV